jgi:hypothetical protein
VDEDVLPVDAGGVVERQARIPHPPAVPVVGSGRVARHGARPRERLGPVGGTPDRVLDPGAGHDLPALGPALPQVELAEPGQVAQGSADAAVGHRVAVGVDGDLRVELRAHRLPQLAGDELVQPLPRRPLDHPRQHVGEDRAVPERAAVRPVVAQRPEVAERVRRPRPPVVRPPQVHALVGAHVGFGILVGLVELGAGPHVQQVLHGGALERGPGQFRDDPLDRGGDVQRAPAGQHAGHGRGHRLGHRHQQVRGVRRHAVEVVLGHDLSLVQHQEAVGVGLGEQLRHGQLAAAGGVAEPEAQQVALGPRQRPGRPRAAADPRRGDQLPDVLEAPPVERRVLPVRERDQFLRAERRHSRHQLRLSHESAPHGRVIQKTVISSPVPAWPSGYFTEPAVMPATRNRCSSRNPTTMGTLTVSDAAMIWFQ